LTGENDEPVLPIGFDSRQTYSWEIASIERPDEFFLDFSKLEVDSTALSETKLLPNGFSFALADDSFRLEYGQSADFNNDSKLNSDDLDAACAVGRDIALFAKTNFGSPLGDINLDGEVRFDDFLVLSSNFGSEGGWSSGDATCDGQIAFADFLILSQNFGSTLEAQSVPEPQQWPGPGLHSCFFYTAAEPSADAVLLTELAREKQEVGKRDFPIAVEITLVPAGVGRAKVGTKH